MIRKHTNWRYTAGRGRRAKIFGWPDHCAANLCRGCFSLFLLCAMYCTAKTRSRELCGTVDEIASHNRRNINEHSVASYSTGIVLFFYFGEDT